ncbi:MAG: FecR domain-containing protein [Tannerellaceae bacterium]|nr:FecR domain-containing protein [Tannerellaceae bacterium]
MDERISKYFQHELSEKERIELLKETLKDDKLKHEISTYQNLLALFTLTKDNINRETGQQSYQGFIRNQRKKKTRQWIRMSLGYAAVICLLVGITWLIAQRTLIPETPLVAQQELFVPAGQRARVTLPDGSIVWLNAGSTLSYPSLFGKERKIFLEGEAYFDVAQNPDQPFIVMTEHIHIKALGTQFNVHSYPQSESMHSTLVSGAIKVYKPEAETEGKILSPNQQLFYEKGDFRFVQTADKDQLLWKDGIYSFKKETLEEIIKKLELYYDVKIHVTHPDIFQYIYTGKFRQQDGVMEILRLIQKIHPYKLSTDEETKEIILSK